MMVHFFEMVMEFECIIRANCIGLASFFLRVLEDFLVQIISVVAFPFLDSKNGKKSGKAHTSNSLKK